MWKEKKAHVWEASQKFDSVERFEKKFEVDGFRDLIQSKLCFLQKKTVKTFSVRFGYLSWRIVWNGNVDKWKVVSFCPNWQVDKVWAPANYTNWLNLSKYMEQGEAH